MLKNHEKFHSANGKRTILVADDEQINRAILGAILENDFEVLYAENGKDYSGKCYISQSACYDDAKDVADMIEAAFPKLCGKVEIHYVGTLIGSHTGPGTVALFFWGDPKFPRRESK